MRKELKSLESALQYQKLCAEDELLLKMELGHLLGSCRKKCKQITLGEEKALLL